jgi:hypothetical protein
MQIHCDFECNFGATTQVYKQCKDFVLIRLFTAVSFKWLTAGKNWYLIVIFVACFSYNQIILY